MTWIQRIVFNQNYFGKKTLSRSFSNKCVNEKGDNCVENGAKKSWRIDSTITGNNIK